MALTLKHCLICQKVFSPDRRTPKQKVCSGVKCQKERKRRKWRRWAAGHRKQRRDKLRLWAQAYPRYWRYYRNNKAKAAYREREIQRMRRKRKSLRRVAKQTHFKAIYLERLRAVQALRVCDKNVAKPTLIQRRLDEVVECLIWKENVAKQTHIAAVPVGG